MGAPKYGEDKYWVRQHDGVITDGALENTMLALEQLGKWFFEKTGKMLVVTSVVDGSSHAAIEHSHYNGWKIDCNDWKGPQGLEGEYFGVFNNDPMTQLARDFIKYGCETLRIGVNLEKNKNSGEYDHFDICVDGEKWSTEDGTPTNDFGGFGNKDNKNRVGDFATVSTGSTHNRSTAVGTTTVGNTIYLNPKNKTFVEPMYPDLITLPGNIPTNLVEQITVNPNNKATSSINSSLKTMDASIVQDTTGLGMSAFASDKVLTKRQKTYDVNQNINDVKLKSGGKPLNNNDRYPVDLKIEELLLHAPQVKLNSITLPSGMTQNDRALATNLLQAADHTEKRLVKIENVLGTVMRYLFGLAGRMQINCVYYGGQAPFSRYKNIRCMKDDRVNDGAIVQIDQCLSCTRYEPVLGQVYEILNEKGVNLANILDDAQSGYYNLRDYAANTRTNRHPAAEEEVEFNPAANYTRDPNDKTFNDGEWDKGLKMNWKYQVLERQKPIINWKQDINKPIDLKKLPSYQFNGMNISQQKGSVAPDHNNGISNKKQQTGEVKKTDNNGGSGSSFEVLSPTNWEKKMAIHYESLKNSADEEIRHFYDIAKDFAHGTGGAAAAGMENIRNQETADIINKYAAQMKIDPHLITSIFIIESMAIANAPNGGIGQVDTFKGKESKMTPEADIEGAMKAWKKFYKSEDGDNPLYACQFFGAGKVGKLTNRLRSPNGIFDKEFLTAIRYDYKFENQGNDHLVTYWPKVVCLYRELVEHDK